MKRVVLLIGFVTLCWHATAHGQELPQQPILRIEAAMHTAAIRRIGVDSGGDKMTIDDTPWVGLQEDLVLTQSRSWWDYRLSAG